MAAIIAKNMDAVGKMDPYVSTTVGVITQKTSVATGAGTSPAWNDILTFQCNPSDVVQMRLYDKDLVGSDYIGEVRVPVQEIINRGGNINGSYPFSSLNNSGTLNVQLRTANSGATASAYGAQPAYNAQPAYSASQVGLAQPQPMASNFGAPISSSTYLNPAAVAAPAAAAMAAPFAATAFAAPATSVSYGAPIATSQFVAPAQSTAFAAPAVSNFSAVPLAGVPAPAVTANPYAAGMNLVPYSGAAPGSTVYTRNPYLANPKDHTPFFGCC